MSSWLLAICLGVLVGTQAAEESITKDIQLTKSVPLGVNPPQCPSRTVHDYLFPGGHGYFFSWEDPGTEKLELNWSEAREFCRIRCMDLVSLETKLENNFIKERLVKGRQRYTWTSGRECNFGGCDRADLLPARVYGWFWTGSLQIIPPSTNRIDTDWDDKGGLGVPQPDNREQLQGGPEEECIAIFNDFYGDGPRWHDVVCNHRMPFVCEDTDAFLSPVSPVMAP